ncbi:MAG: hypothetical protein KAQ81_04210, partial [Deltaproteobacteria bacterium]|nr:hypothetical protein [Deltaproteobacteria bacterium]
SSLNYFAHDRYRKVLWSTPISRFLNNKSHNTLKYQSYHKIYKPLAFQQLLEMNQIDAETAIEE